MKTARQRFSEKYEVTVDGCWEWIGAKIHNGYGQFSFNGKPVLAHRWSYEQTVGKVPDGKELDHLCKNRACVNPFHLEPVTRSENMRRGDIGKATRARSKNITHCPHGHLYSELNTYITKAGTRCCITCKRESTKTWKKKQNRVNS